MKTAAPVSKQSAESSRCDDLEERNTQQGNAEQVESISQDARPAWMACEDTSTRCIDGGVHQPGLQGVVDPLPDADKHQAKAEQQRVSVGNSLDLDRQAHNGARCAKCHKEVVPVLDLEPGIHFFAHGDLPSIDGRIVAQGGAVSSIGRAA